MSAEFSTSSSIFDTVESEYSFVTFAFKRPFMFIQPLVMLSPMFTSRGRDSPVSAVVLRLELPSIIIPSRGTFSPGLITMMSSMQASSGSISEISPSFSIFTYSGQMSISSVIEFLLFPTAIVSNKSPTW